MKKIFAIIPALALAVVLLLSCAGCGGKTLTLNVYNWGEYISDGSEDSLNTVKAFEKWYQEEYGQKVRVNYDTFSSNEDLYAKLSSGAVSYDVIFPSDYMIARMIDENMLLPLDYGNIPNFEYITEDFRNLYYDPQNQFTVPYTYGVVGVIYNAKVVDESDASGWDLLWNEKYSGDILQFNNPRDAFGTAMYKLGIDVNTTDKADWDAAQAELLRQRPLLKGMVMDEIYNMMASGEAAIGTYYAGDYFTMLDMVDEDNDTVDLHFYYPEPTNYYVDAMCIPSCCKNKELAEIFINYMLSEEPAVANAEFTYYASPNSMVLNSQQYAEDMGEDFMEIIYPPMDSFRNNYQAYAYQNLDAETLAYINELWEKVKIN